MKQRKLLLFKNGVQWNTSVVVKLKVTILSLKVSLNFGTFPVSMVRVFTVLEHNDVSGGGVYSCHRDCFVVYRRGYTTLNNEII